MSTHVDRAVQIALADGTLVDDSHPLPTSSGGGGGGVTLPYVGSWVDRSGTITAGGTSQQLMAANASRKAWFIQNTGTDVLWINFAIAAVESEPSIRIPVNGGWEELGPISGQQVNVVSATMGTGFASKEMS